MSKTKADVNSKPASPGDYQLRAKPGSVTSLQSTRPGRREPPLPCQHSTRREQPGGLPLWDAPGLFLCPGVSLSPTPPQGQEQCPSWDHPKYSLVQGRETRAWGRRGKMLSWDPGHPRGWKILSSSPRVVFNTCILAGAAQGSCLQHPPGSRCTHHPGQAQRPRDPHPPGPLGKLRRWQPQARPNSRSSIRG